MEFSQERKEDGARTPSSETDDVEKELHRRRTGGGGGDDEDDDEGTRQPYNCTFCRRGFPTAQALGGHMNVHRKHRGRSSAPSVAAAAQGSSSSCYDQYSATLVAFRQTHPAASASEVSSTAAGESLFVHAERLAPQELRLFGRDYADVRGKEDRRDHQYFSKDSGGDHGEGEDLDLELRLGGAGSL